MNILDYLDKDNLHHAYLIEGERRKVVPEVLKFVATLGLKTRGNPDFYHLVMDSFNIEDAHSIRSFGYEKKFGGDVSKKIFLICADRFLLEAQNALLKMFEEPADGTHFFVIVPDRNVLLPTLVSRLYVVSSRQGLAEGSEQAEQFFAMALDDRVAFLKEFLAETEEDETVQPDSARAKALKLLNALETILSRAVLDKNMSSMSRTVLDITSVLEHLFKVREFLNQPGSSVKSLMESVALKLPRVV